jgi:hypothetical protein
MLRPDDIVDDPVFGRGVVIYQGIHGTHGYMLVDFDAKTVGLRAFKWDDVDLLAQTALEVGDGSVPRN